jgi:hypothetical protein
MATTKERVFDATDSFKPYIERALRDEEIRRNVMSALAAAKELYDELAEGKRKQGVATAATRLATDTDLQDHLRTAVEELRTATRRIKGEERRQSGRAGAMLLIGIVLGILFNPATGPATRSWLKSRVFGGGSSDFTYESSTNGN